MNRFRAQSDENSSKPSPLTTISILISKLEKATNGPTKKPNYIHAHNGRLGVHVQPAWVAVCVRFGVIYSEGTNNGYGC